MFKNENLNFIKTKPDEEGLKSIYSLIDQYGLNDKGTQTVLYPELSLFQKWSDSGWSWLGCLGEDPIAHVAIDLYPLEDPRIGEIRTCVAKSGFGEQILLFIEERYQSFHPDRRLFATVLQNMSGDKFFQKNGYSFYPQDDKEINNLILPYYQNRSLENKKIYIKHFP